MKMKKKLDQQLQELALPLKEYLEKNYDPHCVAIVRCDGVKIIRDEMYIPVATEKQPPEKFVPEDSNGKCLNSFGVQCPS